MNYISASFFVFSPFKLKHQSPKMNHVDGMLPALYSWFNVISSAIFHAYHQQHKHQALPKKNYTTA